MSAALAAGIAAGIGELVKMGIVAATNAAQAEAVMLQNLKPTPPSTEVDDFGDAKDRLGIGDGDPPDDVA